jgi:hypothetical protein
MMSCWREGNGLRDHGRNNVDEVFAHAKSILASLSGSCHFLAWTSGIRRQSQVRFHS